MKDTSKTYYHKGHQLKGWFNEDKEKWYKSLVKKVKNGSIVEIGVYGGASILSITDLCIKNNTKITGIDPWDKIEMVNENTLSKDNVYSYKSMMKNHYENLVNIIKKENYNHITLIKDFSLNVLSNFEDNSIDLVYIDANHSYKEVLKDITEWYNKVKIGGILCGDDFAWDGVKQAVNEFCDSKKIKFTHTKDSWKISKK
jgi:predicted O-methyltransferase YrrM